MNLVGVKVRHEMFGEGTITASENNNLLIMFPQGEKRFFFPDSFENYLKAVDPSIAKAIEKELTDHKAQKPSYPNAKTGLVPPPVIWEKPKRKGRKLYERSNIAFKCNYCDGGKTDEQIGYNGVCSDKLIHHNVEVEMRPWCSYEDSPCRQYVDGYTNRKELQAECEGDGFVCYESQMLRDWRAFAGVAHSGDRKDLPMRLMQVQANSLCVLTTREPGAEESERIIFAVFLVDEAYEGDNRESGFVTTGSKFKIKLSYKEAKSMLFWDYHANGSKVQVAAWGTGLHRYFSDEEAALILRDIAKIKNGTKDEKLSQEFFEHYCMVNNVDPDGLSEPNGALKR